MGELLISFNQVQEQSGGGLVREDDIYVDVKRSKEMWLKQLCPPRWSLGVLPPIDLSHDL